MSYELNAYKTMIIQDVNNYIGEYESGDCKYKGLFEIDPELHKDPSMRIVPIALSNYFIKGIPIKDTIMNHTNIYDFCMRLRVNRSYKAIFTYITEGLQLGYKQLSKNTRYYVSNKGGFLHKKEVNSGKLIGVNVGTVTTIFNDYFEREMPDYDINYKFYIKECAKILGSIENSQLTLF